MSSRRRPPQKKDSNLFTWILLSGVALGLLILGGGFFLNKGPEPAPKPKTKKKLVIKEKKKELEVVQEEEPEPTNSGTIVERDLTPDEVKTAIEEIIKVNRMRIKRAKKDISNMKDPRKVKQARLRIEKMDAFLKRLEKVNPNNRSTWFFVNEEDPSNGNFLDRDELRQLDK